MPDVIGGHLIFKKVGGRPYSGVTYHFVGHPYSCSGGYGLRVRTHTRVLRILGKNVKRTPPPKFGIDTNLQCDLFQKKGTPTPRLVLIRIDIA